MAESKEQQMLDCLYRAWNSIYDKRNELLDKEHPQRVAVDQLLLDINQVESGFRRYLTKNKSPLLRQ